MNETSRRTKHCTGKLPLFGAGRKWNYVRPRGRSRRSAGWWCFLSFCGGGVFGEEGGKNLRFVLLSPTPPAPLGLFPAFLFWGGAGGGRFAPPACCLRVGAWPTL